MLTSGTRLGPDEIVAALGAGGMTSQPRPRSRRQPLDDPFNRTSSKKPTPFIVTPSTESQARLSPDGRWAAYPSGESGQFAVYVTSFPTASTKLRISPTDGREPRWRADGRELYFLAGAGGRFVPLSNIFQYSPASSGQRFLVNVLVSDAEPTLNVITKWQAAARAAR